MKTIMKEISLNTSLLNGFSNAEVFSSVNRSYIFTYTEKGQKSFQTNVIGTSLRSYDKEKKTGRFYVKHGNSDTDNWLENAQVNSVPYSDMPHERVRNDEAVLPSIINEANNCISSLYNKYRRLFAEKGLTLEKLTLERYILAYMLANTYGVMGSGYKLFCSPSVVTTTKNGTQQQYSKIYSNMSFADALYRLYTSLDTLEERKDKDLDKLKVDHILLSNQAVYELIYLLLFFLNDNAIKYGKSYITENMDKLSALRISPLISVQENSCHNEIVGGIVDGEGTMRVPNYIIKSGRFEKLLSCLANGTAVNGSGSAYRFDYNSLPQTKPSKVYVECGDLSIKDVIEQHDLLAVLNTFQGMYESLDRLTFNFTALLDMKIYKYGIYSGQKTIKINSNLIKVLSGISLVTKDAEYVGDGSLRVPAMLCSLRDIAC